MHHPPPNSLIFISVLFKLTSALLFSVMAAFVRYVSDVTPLGEVVFCRSFFAVIPVMIIYTTATVDDEGRIHFFEDIYGLDATLQNALAAGYPYPA